MPVTPEYRLPDDGPVSNVGMAGRKTKQVRFLNEQGQTFEKRVWEGPYNQRREYKVETKVLCNAYSIEAADKIVRLWNAHLEDD